MSIRKKGTNVTTESEQVEHLLQAEQDEALLKLSVDSHMARVAPDYLQPDLDHRFQALRSKPSSAPRQSPANQQRKPRRPDISADDVDEELSSVLGDDLSARFAALKASLSSSSSGNDNSEKDEIKAGSGKSDGYDKVGGAAQEDEDDEVEKVIRWAIDAARLDPSLSEEEEEDSDDSDDDHNHRKSKKATKKSSRRN